jgi:uncharacterized membrane protein
LERGKSDRYLILTIAIIIINTLIYSVIDYLKYSSYGASVFDLGLAAQTLYNVTHVGINVSNLVINKLIYIPLGLIYYLYPVPVALQYIQAFIISLGALPIYLISRELTGRRGVSLAFAILWIIYYPLGGVFWFDFHFMSFFPTLFLFGVYFYLRGKTSYSLLFLILASITDFLSPVIVAFFAIYVMNRDFSLHGTDPYRNRLSMPVLVITLAIFLLIVYYYGPSYFLSYLNRQILTYNPSGSPVEATIPYKIGYFLYLMLPLFFLSLAGIEFLLTMIPYIALALVNSYYPYVNTMLYQYPSLTSASIFVAAIIGVSRLMKGKKIRISYRNVKKVAVALIAFNVFLAAFLSPVGNLFTESHEGNVIATYVAGLGENYNSRSYMAYNPNLSYLNSAPHYVPPGSSLLIQDNMPQMVQNYNWTLPFEYNYSTPSRYVAIDTYSADFTHFYLGKNSSRNMMYMANGFLLNSTYSIIDQFGGIIYMEMGNHPVSAFSGIRISMVSGKAAQISEKINGTILAPGNYSISMAPNSSISEDSLNVSLSVFTNPYGISEHLNLTFHRSGKVFISYFSFKEFTEISTFSPSITGKISLIIVQNSSM